MSSRLQSSVFMVTPQGEHIQNQQRITAELVGHSFPKRLKRYLNRTGSSMLKLTQVKVFWRCVGGLKVNYFDDVVIQDWIDKAPEIIVIDVGSNDLTNPEGPDPHQMALKLVQMMEQVQRAIGCEVVFVEQFFRVLQDESRMHWLNSRISKFNGYLYHLSRNMSNMTFFRHRNLWQNWKQYIGRDGVHLSDEGNRRYARSYRGILMQASARWSARYFRN